MNIDKSSWEKVALGDVVSKEEENDKGNAKNRFDRFLKVEHLDRESLNIKRWASQEKDELPPTFYKIFRKGQILFPTRNPHLRRAALASFDGICGEKTLTLEPNTEVIMPGFLPFLFHSDAFYAHTTSAIIGSTNPHVRWRDVAKFEFLLPQKEQQAELAELFWSGNDVVKSDILVKQRLEIKLEAEIEYKIYGESINGYTISEAINRLEKRMLVKPLKNLGDIFKGRGIPKSDVIEGGIPCVRYGELYTRHHKVIRDFHSSISSESAKNAVKLEKNDILFAGSGETIAEIGKSAAFVGDHIAYAGSDILIFRPENMDGIYLGYLMNSQLVRQQLNKLGTGATVMHVYGADIGSIKIPVRTRNEQEEIGLYLEGIASRIVGLINKLETFQALQKQLVNQVF